VGEDRWSHDFSFYPSKLRSGCGVIFRTNVLDALMDALGTTYSEEEHGTALRKFLETDSTGSPASTSDSELLYQDVFG
jgi:hypothetical protein